MAFAMAAFLLGPVCRAEASPAGTDSERSAFLFAASAFFPDERETTGDFSEEEDPAPFRGAGDFVEGFLPTGTDFTEEADFAGAFLPAEGFVGAADFTEGFLPTGTDFTEEADFAGAFLPVEDFVATTDFEEVFLPTGVDFAGGTILAGTFLPAEDFEVGATFEGPLPPMDFAFAPCAPEWAVTLALGFGTAADLTTACFGRDTFPVPDFTEDAFFIALFFPGRTTLAPTEGFSPAALDGPLATAFLAAVAFMDGVDFTEDAFLEGTVPAVFF